MKNVGFPHFPHFEVYIPLEFLSMLGTYQSTGRNSIGIFFCCATGVRPIGMQP